ncbi:MAG: histidine--tRNA ligase [Ekhidna sp.]|nr:histidine--tRNA ligase [Ekhidna sp.]
MSKTKPSLPRGTRDFGPKVMSKRSFIIDIIRKNFIKYGFAQIETPAMENLSVLTGKYGDEGDQLLYKILNSGDFLSKTSKEDIEKGSRHLMTGISEKGLRYDLTVPFARYVVMNQNEITFPFKRFQIQPVWRADRPQKGRYREFYQCDADIVGSKGLWNEIELTLLFTDVFCDLKLEDYIIKINHRALLFSLAESTGLKEQIIPFCAEIDKIDKMGEDKVAENIKAMGANDRQINELLSLFHENNKEIILERLINIGVSKKVISAINSYFDALAVHSNKKIKVALDLSLARGLSYYTGMIFEVKPTSVSMGSIGGGGRYDDLTGVFGLKGISGVGISFGLDRIYDVMQELKLFPQKIAGRLDVLIVHFSEENLKHAYGIVSGLRDKGIKAELYPETAKIKKQFDYSDKIGVPYTLIVGDNEMASGRYMLRDMQTGDQKPLKMDEIIHRLKQNGER